MHRNLLHIALALLAFTVGFLTVGTYEHLTVALPSAFIIFLLLKKIIGLNITLHHVQVAFLTLLIWLPLTALFLSAFPSPFTESCVIELPEEKVSSLQESDKLEHPVLIDVVACPFWEKNYDEVSNAPTNHNDSPVKVNSNIFWVGVVDDKTISKPAPYYPPEAKASRIKGTVAVAIVIDTSIGMVISAQALSGHPLLHQSAVEAAYQARFKPLTIHGASPNVIKVSGILTYRFGIQ